MHSSQSNSLIRVDIVSSKGKQINTFKFFKRHWFFFSQSRCKFFWLGDTQKQRCKIEEHYFLPQFIYTEINFSLIKPFQIGLILQIWPRSHIRHIWKENRMKRFKCQRSNLLQIRRSSSIVLKISFVEYIALIKCFFSGQQNLLSTLPWRLCQMFFLFKSYEYSKHISV